MRFTDSTTTLGAAVIVSENSVQNPADTDQDTPDARPGGRKTLRVLALVAIVLALVVSTSLGSVLVNVDWPGGVLAWLRVAIGAVLLTLALLCGELLIRIINVLRRGRPGNGNLDLLDRLGAALARPKRVVAVLVIALAWSLAVWLAPPVFSAPTASPEFEPGELVLVSAIDESPSDPRRVLIQQWDQLHPQNHVRVENVPGEPDAQHASMVAHARGDRAPTADVLALDIVWMTEFIENDYIRPIDETGLSTDDFLPNVLDTAKDLHGGRDGLWALPLNSDAGLLYYRPDLADMSDSTWDDLFGANAKSTFANVTHTPELEAANAAQLADQEVLTVTAFEAIWAADGHVVNEDGGLMSNGDEVDFDNKARAGIKALATAAKADRAYLQAAKGLDETEATDKFGERRTVVMRNWPVAHDKLMSAQNPIQFKVAPLPGHSVLGGQNLAIASSTDKPRAAQALIEFLTSPSSELLLLEAGGFAPTRDSAYNNTTRSYSDVLRRSVIDARPRPLLSCYTEFSREFRKGIARALQKGGELEADFPRVLAKIANKHCPG